MIEIVSVVSMLILVVVIVIGFFVKQKNKEKAREEKLDTWIETHKKIILGTILLVGILARIIGLGSIPQGLHIDEAGMAYDASCIWKYGTDRYGNSYPLYFTNFGQGQSALSTYLVSPFVGIFGINAWSVRLPIVFISIMAMVAMYVVVTKWKNTKMALLLLFLMATCPWHIMQARWGLDCNLLSSMLVFSILALSKAKRPLGYVGAGIVIGLTLYTYVLSYVIVPIFLGLTILYLLWIRKITWKNVILLGIPIFLLALPLMYMLLLNNHILPKVDFPIVSIPELPIYRGGELGWNNIQKNWFNLPIILFFGDDMMYNVPEGFGSLYIISIPFAIIGLVEAVIKTGKSIRNKQMEFSSIMLFQWIATYVCMLLIAEPKINKANAIFIPMLYFTMLGIFYFAKELPSFLLATVLVYIVHFAIFEQYYFTDFKNNTDLIYDAYFDDSITEITKYVNQEEKYQNKKIHFELRTWNSGYYKKEPYIYTLLASNITPEDFSKTMKKDSNQTIYAYDKYTFYHITEYNKDTVYVLLHPLESMLQELKDNQFTIEQVGDYFIGYAEE